MIIPALITILTVSILALAWNCYRICFYSPKKGRSSPYDPMRGPQYEAVEDTIFRIIGIMEQYPYEAVEIRAQDGVSLQGRYYHVNDKAPLMLLFHGYRSAALRDCCGGHALAQKLGFNALVVDQRAHGNSGGRTISFGIRERHDVHAWLQYASNRFGTRTPVILYGLSMGAATVLMGCADGYAHNAVCIIADSPYSAPADIIRKVCRDCHYPLVLYPFIYLGALIFGRFRLNSCTAEEAVRQAAVPVLILHGADDRLVPADMSRKIAASNTQFCRVYTVPGAGHGLSFLIDPAGCEAAIMDLLSAVPALNNYSIDSRKKQEN